MLSLSADPRALAPGTCWTPRIRTGLPVSGSHSPVECLGLGLSGQVLPACGNIWVLRQGRIPRPTRCHYRVGTIGNVPPSPSCHRHPIMGWDGENSGEGRRRVFLRSSTLLFLSIWLDLPGLAFVVAHSPASLTGEWSPRPGQRP